MCCILQTRHVLVLYFAFVIAVIRNADSLQLIKFFKNQMGKGRGPGGGRFLLYVF